MNPSDSGRWFWRLGRRRRKPPRPTATLQRLHRPGWLRRRRRLLPRLQFLLRGCRRRLVFGARAGSELLRRLGGSRYGNLHFLEDGECVFQAVRSRLRGLRELGGRGCVMRISPTKCSAREWDQDAECARPSDRAPRRRLRSRLERWPLRRSGRRRDRVRHLIRAPKRSRNQRRDSPAACVTPMTCQRPGMA